MLHKTMTALAWAFGLIAGAYILTKLAEALLMYLYVTQAATFVK